MRGTVHEKYGATSYAKNTHPNHHRVVSHLKGINRSYILSNPTDQTSYVSCVWFQDIITFMFKNNIHVNTYQFFTLKAQIMNDICILYNLIQLKLTTTELIQLN